MGRLIDADKLDADLLIEQTIDPQTYTIDEVRKIVKEQPTVDAKRAKNDKWIKCSDRLPEITIANMYSDDVLVAVKWNDGNIYYDIAWYHINGKWNCDSDTRKVVAWQPLPEPFEE